MTVSELILETAIREAGDVCDVRLEKAFAEELLEILREHNTIHSCIKEKCCICPHCSNCDVDEKGKIKSGQDATAIGSWVNAKERLPEKEKDVIIYGYYVGPSGATYPTTIISDIEEFKHCECVPVAWMPLPEPPKEENWNEFGKTR